MIPFTATYRMQLRDSVGFAEAQAFLPWLRRTGFSHLYLAPIFTAVRGSTHGYDVADPTRIDDGLGGEAGFVALAEAAHAAGIGILLDIVPNHTAFSPENPWLRDVLRLGEASRYARHFDIDWSQRLMLPFLPDPFARMLAEGRIGIGEERGLPVLTADDLAIPLRTDVPALDPSLDGLAALHDAQVWRLTYWERERREITHRRFFNVTGLIGMRVEDPVVFDDMHAKVFDLVDRGLVDGLRVDHVDGLADPDAYLARLRSRIGDMPVWVEKILTRTEALPDWPIAGTTGYEAARTIARVLTNGAGHATLLAAWREETGTHGSFADAVLRAKGNVVGQDLPAEFHQTVMLARRALEASPAGADLAAAYPRFGVGEGSAAEPGDAAMDGLREVILALLIAFPRYRTYFGPLDAATRARPEDRAVVAETVRIATLLLGTDTAVRAIRRAILRADRMAVDVPGTLVRQTAPMIDDPDAEPDPVGTEAPAGPVSPAATDLLATLAGFLTDAATAEARAFRTRFQQVTGALLAKAHEDTAAFRWNPYLAANEVGADPDEPTMAEEERDAWLRTRPPMSLTLTASHDTKRSGDARMRLTAISHLPDDFATLVRSVRSLPKARAVSRNRRWYLAQSALAIWQPEDPDLADRLADHMIKALREARQITVWAHPDEDAEATVTDLARAVVAAWRVEPPGGLARLVARGTRLSLIQTALALTLPGIPDVYGDGLGLDLALTDPDNRRRVDLPRLEAMASRADASGRKARLIAALLLLRRRHPGFFDTASCEIEEGSLVRTDGAHRLRVRFDPDTAAVAGGTLWPEDPGRDGDAVAVDWT